MSHRPSLRRAPALRWLIALALLLLPAAAAGAQGVDPETVTAPALTANVDLQRSSPSVRAAG